MSSDGRYVFIFAMKFLLLVLVGFLQLPLMLAAVPQTSPDILVPVKAGVCIDPLNYGPEFHHFVRAIAFRKHYSIKP